MMANLIVLIVGGFLLASVTALAEDIGPADGNGNEAPSKWETGLCQPLQIHYCYGEQLPYLNTSTLFRVSNRQPYFRLRSPAFFKQSERFRNLPECWSALQPMLCALRHPKCDTTGKRSLNRKICDRAMDACQAVKENIPDFLSNCSDSHLFGQDSDDMEFADEMLSLPFNKTEMQCPTPLAPTNDSARFFGGITSCGMQCQDPFLGHFDVGIFHIVVLVLTIVVVVLNVFGLASIILKLKIVRSSHFNPDRCVLYMNVSFLFASTGYLFQFFPETRNLVTCTEDGLRQQLVRMNDWSVQFSLCLLSFLLTYIFTLSGLVWFGHLMFACFLDFQKIINSHRKTKVTTFPLARSSLVFFHGTAWLLPLVPAIAMVLLKSVEGNSLLGVCMITPRYKTAFVITPFAIVLLTVSFFTGLYWWNLRQSQLSQFGTLKTQRNVLRRLRLVGLICLVVLVLHILQLAGIWCLVHNEQIWNDKLLDFIQCQLKSSTSEAPQDCTGILKPVRKSYLGAFYAMIVPYFSTGIAISMWTWNSSNLRRWKALVYGGKLSEMQIYRNTSRGDLPDYELKDDGRVVAENGRMLLKDPILKKTYSVPRNATRPAEVVLAEKDHTDRRKFQRNSIIQGQKINSVAVFEQEPDDKLENWQERARECRLGRRKSDIGLHHSGGSGFRVSGNHQSHHNLVEHRVASASRSINRTSSHGSALHQQVARKNSHGNHSSSSQQPAALVRAPSLTRKPGPAKRGDSISSSEFIQF